MLILSFREYDLKHATRREGLNTAGDGLGRKQQNACAKILYIVLYMKTAIKWYGRYLYSIYYI